MTPWKIEFPWKPGRQGTGYYKMRLFGWEPWLDCYLLRYPPGAYIPGHTDPVDKRRHYRCNVVLKRATRGGHFWSMRELVRTRRSVDVLFRKHGLRWWQRVAIFRPDQQTHGVFLVEQGTRYVLSIGVSIPRAAAP